MLSFNCKSNRELEIIGLELAVSRGRSQNVHAPRPHQPKQSERNIALRPLYATDATAFMLHGIMHRPQKTGVLINFLNCKRCR